MADNKQYGPLTSKQTTASDIRSVIANSTKKSGKGYTIATKEEITEAKQKKEQPKTIKSISVKGGLNNTVMQNAIKNNGIKVAPDTSTIPKVYSPEYQQTKMQEQVLNTPTPVNPNTSFSVQMKTVGNNGRMGSYSYDNAVQYFNDNTIDTNSALYQLNEDITSIVNEGRSGDYNPGHIKQYYWEFSALDDSVMEELMSDLANNHLGQELTEKDIQGIYSKYPELNLIRKGWFRGYDGNTQKVSGGVRGWANNISRNFSTAPLEGEQDENGFVGMADKLNVFGNLGTRLDQFAQNTFQVQGSEGAEKIKNVLINMTDDDMRRMWNKYVQWVNKNPDEAIAYVKNNGGPEKIKPLFGSVKFTTEEIAPAFQNWVIDQINKEQNGFWGEVMNKGANFKKDTGPNDLQKLDDATLGKAREWLSEGGEAAKELRENTDNNALKVLYGTAEVATRVAQGAAYLPRFITDFATESFWDANKEEVLANLPGSAVKGVTTMVNAATNWYDTAVGIGKLFATEEGANVLKDMYGSEENVTKSFQRDPVGTLMDVFGAAEAITHMTSAAVKATKMVPGATYVAANMIGADRLAKMSKNILDVLDEASKSLTAKGNTLGSISDLGITDLHRGLMNKIQAYLKQGSKPGFWNKAVRAGAWYTAITQDTLGTLKLLAGSNNHSLQELGRLAQQIVQGDSKTGEAFIRAKDSGYLDTEGVKDYAGLQEQIKKGEKRYGEDIESALGGEEGVVNKENTNQKTDEGTEYNRYQDAIDGLKELYEKTGDYDALDAIKKLEQKFNGEGLTKLETKKLISEYGREFNTKGWGKNGEPLTSQSAEKVQNTKVGMNEWLKENLSEAAKEAMENIDRNYGDLKSVEKAVNKVLKSLDNMGKKISGETVTSKIGNFVGGTAAVVGAFTDIIGGRGIGTILGLISKSVIDKMTKRPKNLPLKDVQAQLSKNIKKFDKMLTSLNKRYTSVGAAVLATSMKNQGVIDEKTYNKIIEKLNPNLKEDVKPRESIKNKNGLEQKSGGELRNDIIEEVNKAIDIEDIKDIREVVDNFKNKLTKDDIKAINDAIKDTQIEYAYAQEKARSKAGDKEHVLSAEDKERVTNFIKKRAKDVGFVTEMFENLPFDEGFTHLRDKLIAFSKNPGDTTAKHELFHAFFSVCDNKTKTYLIQEARKILKDNGMAIKDAEEWLAESFGIYAKRKMIDLGMIKNAPKGFVDKLRNFFQKVYEYMQRFNGDRATINKLFDEVLGEKQMKDGIMDLSDLLGDKKLDKKLLREIELGDNGLRNKSVYHGSPADFEKFDSSHMGEGEGAQAHGWGHYVAVNKGTAQHYAKIGGGSSKYKGKHLGELKNSDIVENKVAADVLGRIDVDYNLKDAIKNTRAYYEEMKGYAEDSFKKNHSEFAKKNIDHFDKLIKAVDNLKESDFDKVNTRNLYNLDIPDPVKKDTPTGRNYLEEDAKLTWEELKDFSKAYGEELKYSQIMELARDYKNRKGEMPNGKWLYETIGILEGMDKQRKLGYVIGQSEEQKAASKFLESLGYDGIHYFGGRDGEAYVIFNDDALQIKEHIRYKKKIGDKEVEITPKVTSPDELIEKNADGLSVMKSFISEKQAEKALNVNKALLDKDGNPYLWTHTNKYDALQFANFENTMDSKYKGYTDQGKEIAWVTNSEDMSRSYADQKSVLANTKSFKDAEDFNNHFKENPVKGGKTRDGMEKVVNVKLEKEKLNGEDIWVLKQQTTNIGEYNKLKDLWEKARQEDFVREYKMPKDEIEAMNKIKNAIKNRYRYSIDDVKIEKKDGKYILEEKFKPFKSDTKVYGWRDEKEAVANAFRFTTKPGQYHYQGILQDMKNPLVVDIRNPDGSMTNWSRLGTVDEMFKKEGIDYNKNVDFFIRDVEEAMDGFTNRMKALEDYWNNAYRDDPYSGPSQLIGNVELAANQGASYMVEELGNLVDDVNLSEDTKKALNQKVYGDLAEYGDTLKDAILELRDYMDTDRNYLALNNLSPDGISKWVSDMGAPAVLQKMMKGKHWKDLLNTWRDVGDKTWRENIKEQLTTNGMWLETNDWVKYALDKGGYDGVIFKQISDYGGNSNTHKGGDVVAMFNSKQFKAWDNANPTDSKYISYKKKVSLDKKSEGLSKKDSSGLLAKGRDRMGDNGIRYKSAWHGSPNQFDRFDSSHMGEGEGAQAHGWGHYVAVDKKVAKRYADMNKEYKYLGDGYRTTEGLTNKDMMVDHFLKLMNNGDKFEDIKKVFYEDNNKAIIKDAKEALKELDRTGGNEYEGYSREDIEWELKKAQNELDLVNSLKKKDFAKSHLYELDIPDPVKRDTPTGKNYIEEKDIVTEEVRDEFMKKLEEYGLSKAQKNRIWDNLGYFNNSSYGTLYKRLSRIFGSDEQASKFLESLGYDGIHYFGGRDGEAYVLFNDNSPKIKNSIRYKKGLTAKDQTQTPEFKKWFEGSKVVDKSGKPLVMYHGTNSDFNTFDKGLIKSQNWGKGFYFTSNKEDAKQYGKNTKAVYLDVKNPLDLTSGENDAEYNKWYGKKNSPYDGYVVNLSNGDKMVVVKSPNQIKSATDNIGTFDKNNPDIRYKKGLEKKESGLEKKDNGIRYKVIKGTDADMRANLGKLLRMIRNDAIAGGLTVSKYTNNGPLENALNTIWNINNKKRYIQNRDIYEGVVGNKLEGMMQLANIIDGGNNVEDLHYKWYYDPAEKEKKYRNTLIFWKGDTLKDNNYWAVHLPNNKQTRKSIAKFRKPNGKLERTPLRHRYRKVPAGDSEL